MKPWILLVALSVLSALVPAQTTPAQIATVTAKPAQPGQRPHASHVRLHGSQPRPVRAVRQARAAAVSASARPEPLPLSEAELALAQRVHLGRVPCELGASVQVDADDQHPGYFHVTLRRTKFHMAPVETSTGAIRLEDQYTGGVWLQLANKSMLVSSKSGQRLVDACMNPGQAAVAQALERGAAPGLLDELRPAAVPNAIALQDATN